MVAITVSAPLDCKGSGAHGGVVVLVATVGAVVKSFKGTPKAWSRYWPSLAFRHRSSDIAFLACLLIFFVPGTQLPFVTLHFTTHTLSIDP